MNLSELSKKNGIIAGVYGDLVNEKIRARYSVSAELAILRQKDAKLEEWEAFNAFAERCKDEARAELGLDASDKK